MSAPHGIRTVSDINTDQLLEILTFYHRFYDEEIGDVIDGVSDLQNFWQTNTVKEFHDDSWIPRDIDVIYPFWDDSQKDFNTYASKISKGFSVLPQVMNDVRDSKYPLEQIDNLLNAPKEPPPKQPSFFGSIKNKLSLKKNFDPNSPYRLSLKEWAKFLRDMETVWDILNDYQTKGTNEWSRLILDATGQKGYRNIMLENFNYFIAPRLSRIYHYGIWLNLKIEKDLSRDIMMVGMQQTLRKEQENNQPVMPSQPTIEK